MQSYIPLPDIKLERRVAPRFPTSFQAGMAAGFEIIPILVHNISITGAGIEVIAHDSVVRYQAGTTCLLRLPLGADLPVTISHVHLDGARLRVGLQFGRLITDAQR